MHHVPWSGPDGSSGYPTHCRPLAKLHGAADVGYTAGYAEQRSSAVDEAGCDESHEGRLCRDCGVRGLAETEISVNTKTQRAQRHKENQLQRTFLPVSFVPLCPLCP